jgi:hypothetical protein
MARPENGPSRIPVSNPILANRLHSVYLDHSMDAICSSMR